MIPSREGAQKMSDIIKVLYEKFLMRDLLGKVSPGFVAVATVLSALDVKIANLFPDERFLWILWVSALPVLFLVGLALQIVGEFIGLCSPSPRPRYILFRVGNLICWGLHKLTKCDIFLNWRNVNEDFDQRVSIICSAPKEVLEGHFQANYERFVYLKEGSGNMALVLFVVWIWLLQNTKWTDIRCIFLVALALALWASHWLHAYRQAKFEILTLNKIKVTTGGVAGQPLLPDLKAKEMLARFSGSSL